MKRFLYLISPIFIITSCTTVRKVAEKPSPPVHTPADTNPRFINDISITSLPQPAVSVDKVSFSSRPDVPPPADELKSSLAAIERCDARQFKFGILMDMPVELIANEKLLRFLDEWYGTPYLYGGTTKKGIDCSAFSSSLLSAVYGISVPRSSREQYGVCMRVSRSHLKEGDLVFFNTRGRVSHVGVYLGNNKFVHSSTSSGVTISDLDDAYYVRKYYASGRIVR